MNYVNEHYRVGTEPSLLKNLPIILLDCVDCRDWTIHKYLLLFSLVWVLRFIVWPDVKIKSGSNVVQKVALAVFTYITKSDAFKTAPYVAHTFG